MSRSLQAGLGATLLGLLIWQGLIWIFDLPRFILPDPPRVAQALWQHRVLIAENAAVTALEIVGGVVIGITLGFLNAVQLAYSPAARSYVMPILVFTQAMPVFALAPLLMIWFGFGIWPKIAIATLIIYFPVTSILLDGLLATPPGYRDLARTMGASRWRTMWHVQIPAAIPALCSGLQLAAVYAPIGAFIGEWVGASDGLGALMTEANGRAKTDLMFAALFVFATFTVLFHAVVSAGCRWLAARFT